MPGPKCGLAITAGCPLEATRADVASGLSRRFPRVSPTRRTSGAPEPGSTPNPVRPGACYATTPGEEEEPDPKEPSGRGFWRQQGPFCWQCLPRRLYWHKWRKISVAALYEKIQRRLRLFGWPRQPWETPREHVNRVEELPMKPVFAEMVDSLEAAVVRRHCRRPAACSSEKALFPLLRLLWHRLANRRRR